MNWIATASVRDEGSLGVFREYVLKLAWVEKPTDEDVIELLHLHGYEVNWVKMEPSDGTN